MKKLVLFSMLFAIALNVLAQRTNDKAYHAYNSQVTAGYGIGNFWTVFLDKAIEIPGYKVSSLGPFSLLYEYGFTNHISSGIALSYSRARGKAERFQIADQISFYSVILRADYHFFTTRKIDPYAGIGLGISKSTYKNLDEHTIGNYNSKVPNTFEPNGQLGIKYFPFQHWGICAELGYIGGAFGLVGITGSF
ncbi:MAG: outer membrane beta-barrel protein [Bacteroidetes bacterium]|nr:outer membrane beta-barrel protein [Bacteroidota bacterium]